MKKVVFSAIALVMFSFAGMANNSVEKEMELISDENTNKTENKIEEVQSCGSQYLEDFERLENLGFTFKAAGDIAFYYFQKCTGTL